MICSQFGGELFTKSYANTDNQQDQRSTKRGALIGEQEMLLRFDFQAITNTKRFELLYYLCRMDQTNTTCYAPLHTKVFLLVGDEQFIRRRTN